MFTLYLMRERDRLEDDIVQVRRVGDTFTLRYFDAETRLDRLCRNLNQAQAWSYLFNLFYAISVDTDPFYHFQISMTGFPSIVYAISDLDTTPVWAHVMTLVNAFFQHTWVPRPAAPPREPSSGRAPEAASDTESGEVSPLPPWLPASPLGSEPPHNSEWGGEEPPTTASSSVSL